MDILKQCLKWHENDEYRKIIDALEAVHAGERTPDMDQNFEDPGALADILWQSAVWYFWWD